MKEKEKRKKKRIVHLINRVSRNDFVQMREFSVEQKVRIDNRIYVHRKSTI